MAKADKKNKEENSEKSFAHARINCERRIYGKLAQSIENTHFFV